MRADAVQKVTVVGDDDDHAVIVIQEVLQPVDRIQVEVVRGLVQQQGLGMPEQRLREQHADFLSALQLAHLAFVQFVGNVEAIQQDGGVALGCITVFFADDAFQFAQPHAVFVRHFGLLVNLVALFQGRPQALVSHDDGVDHAIGVKGELVLAQYAELPRANDGTLLGSSSR